jgi:ribonuclease VapC
MIVDTSALLAILYREPEAKSFVERIEAADVSRLSVANYVELAMVVESQLGADGMRQAEAFLRRAGVVVEPVTLEHGELARQAFLDFGKGRHKAAGVLILSDFAILRRISLCFGSGSDSTIPWAFSMI